MANTAKKHLLRLFDRPRQPLFVPQSDGKVFDVPQNYLTDRYKPLGVELSNRFSEEATEHIPVKEITIPPFGEILDLDRHDNFSLFIPKHRKIAGKLINIFLGMRNVEDLLSVATFAHDHVNPYLFNYAISVAIMHRPDTRDLDLPSFIQTFPDKFIDSKVFARAQEELNVVDTGSRIPIEIPMDYTASDLEAEHRVAYFREDLGINLHHWHWHLIYPFEGERRIVAKDRRGELFFWMHQQMQARYNFERLCNKMKRVTRFTDWRGPIEEAYFPKLDNLVASRSYPGRAANSRLSDINREVEQIRIDIADLERWRDRIYGAIHAGFLVDEQGKQIPLTENEGIDVLANAFEASVLSPNRSFYGDLHTMGHVFFSFVHDPDHRHLEPFGVMGDPATTMRDPIFFRWHAFVDDVFQQFKATLPRYEPARLNYQGVTVSDIKVQSKGSQENVLNTFWQKSDVDLTRGMDFQPRGSVFARFTHLQHQPFNYAIKVNNNGASRMGTCRIFLAPKFDERGNPWLFVDQKNMFIELDRFPVNLKPGPNTILRSSTQSSVTIPFERTFRNLEQNRPTGGDALEQFNYCGCGWPQHMLIPKGTPEGFPCHLFVMISNFNDDRVNQSIEGECNDAFTYCGLKDKLYPDRHSMGYPFDRMPRDGVSTLQQFLTPNMRVQEISIRFTDRVIGPAKKN